MAGHLRQVLAGPDELAERAAELFVMACSSAIGSRGAFHVALSGGTTPGLFFNTLTRAPYTNGIEWDKAHLYFADERCVPPDDNESNFKLLSDTILYKVTTHPHRVEGELGPQEAARRYEALITAMLGPEPVFDMIFLGMGEDGHTASLFPGSSALEAHGIAVPVPDREPPRVSLTMPVINAARTMVFHVTGSTKSAALKRVFSQGEKSGLPAAMVNERAIWLMDEEAASGL